MKINYLSKLIFYLKESRDLYKADLITLRSLHNYLKSVFDKNSAKDMTNILMLEKLIDKFDYSAKYYDVCIDFYEDKK